ncbi:chromosome segregation protein Csm1/Pcs1-domain-containing protein [Aspergillus cavernicola]|uniref:Chromosome segregation protein Csm1/Pcs1-domain-containing protein n=1 Tax=Aspergillus cavernicola TaxID=176166 RepID=A0ABR4J075_9EURO
MPKRKVTTRLSGLIGSDDEDAMQTGAQSHDERPAKKSRGRPRSKSGEMNPPLEPITESVAAPQETEPTTRRGTRRGRPKGSRNSGPLAGQDVADESARDAQLAAPQETDGEDEIATSHQAAQPEKSTRATKGAGVRGKRKVSAQKDLKTDGEFEYTPTSTRHQKPIEKPDERPEPAGRRRPKSVTSANERNPEADQTAQEVVDETIIQEEVPDSQFVPVSPTKRRQPSLRALQSSPSKRKSGGDDDKGGSEPELRRRLGDLTKKYDTLENRYRNLKDIGIVEANSNMEKLKKQCESMTTASNNLITALKAELDSQKALGQKSRSLQKQLGERDAEVARLTSEAEQATGQLAGAQSEVKALQTKLAAARNTTATLEQAALKVPGSAIKGGGANRANAAANAEAAHAAQFAQLKEDLYSDLTGLIIRDVKKREKDSLYDCIQTGVNGTLHFKLVVPHVSSVNFETAEFQYIPLLDEDRDRELVDILPEYLTVDITFIRQQASKFYTRVIDALTKRRASQGN